MPRSSLRKDSNFLTMDCSPVLMARRTPKTVGITKQAAMLDQKDKRQPAEPQLEHRLPQASHQVRLPASRKSRVINRPRTSNVSPNQLLHNLQLRKRVATRWARDIRPPVDQERLARADRNRRRCCRQTLRTIFRCSIRDLFFSY